VPTTSTTQNASTRDNVDYHTCAERPTEEANSPFDVLWDSVCDTDVICTTLGDITGNGGQTVWTSVDGIDQQDDSCQLNGAPAEPAAPVITPAMVAEAFDSLPLAIPQMRTNPPAPACAVLNLENNFWLEVPDTTPQTFDLLGVPVTVYPTPVEYTFDFGDGNGMATADAGAPFPDGTNVHTYTTEGRFEATVAVTWSADWEAPGIPRQPVPGTAETVSDPAVIYAHEWRILLVDDPAARLPASAPIDAGDPCGQP
jgi:hypothetical protein